VADRPAATGERCGPADVAAGQWPAARHGAGKAIHQPEDRSMKKILLVEDNELNRDMLSRRLRKRGYDVVTAVDGEDGIAKARAEAPALILMDVSLPGIDGWETTRRLRSAPETRQIPIVALTAHVLPADHDKALAAGCDDFDTKPIELPRLLGKIETLLTKGQRA
jgi:two-component system, cell cycle response regulator DivK